MKAVTSGQCLTVCLIIAGGLVPPVSRATTWVSPITNAVVWTKADSPHTWAGQLDLIAGAVVTVEPGAVVVFPQSQVLNVNAGAQIIAVGTADDRIVFGGVSDTTPGGELFLGSSLTSEFRYCHFSNISQIRIFGTAPQANHLIEHCVFRKFSAHVIYLHRAPARILHCIFQNNPAGVFGVYMYNITLTVETTPTIWYNAFDRNGLVIAGDRDVGYSCGNYDFFRHNRVNGGTGVAVYPGRYGSLADVVIADCDLGACERSVHTSGETTVYALTVQRCNLSALVSDGGAGTPIGCTNFTGNYWGTTDLGVVSNRLFGGGISTNYALPIAVSNLFPQADVDNSDAGNATRQGDADLVKKYIVGMTNLTTEQIGIADVDHNGKVDARDALIIESYVNGLIWKLPVP